MRSASGARYTMRKVPRICAHCGATGKHLQVDHIIPRRIGGDNRRSNLQWLCPPCHKAKTKIDVTLDPIPQEEIDAWEVIGEHEEPNAIRWQREIAWRFMEKPNGEIYRQRRRERHHRRRMTRSAAYRLKYAARIAREKREAEQQS